MGHRPLPRTFYERNTIQVAKDLLGKILIRRTAEGQMTGRIVETEAYRGSDDPASHAYRGATQRSRLMFGRGGIAYVYYVYGFHHCLNATTESPGTAGAVLIRAIEPLGGIKNMRLNRPLPRHSRAEDLTNGPGKLAKAMNVTLKLNGTDLTTIGALYIAGRESATPPPISTSTRVGVKKGSRRPWRFFTRDNEFVS